MSAKRLFSLIAILSLTLALTALPAVAAPPSTSTSGDHGFTQSYTVAQGDTLSGLAREFGTTIDLLARANGLSDPNRIRVGQTLMAPATPADAADPDIARDILDQQQLSSEAVAFDYYDGKATPQDADDVASSSTQSMPSMPSQPNPPQTSD
jgi:LysM repeat protein